MPRSIVTLDISADEVRLLQVRGDRLERWAAAPLEPGLVDNGIIVNPAALGARIRELMRASGIRGRPVVASVGSLYSVARLLQVPLQTGQTDDRALAQLVAQAVPVEQLRLQWQLITPDGSVPKVFIVGVPETVVQTLIQVLGFAGLKPIALETRGMALVRAVNRAYAIIANMEQSSLDVVLLASRVPEIMRSTAMDSGSSVPERAEFVVKALRGICAFYDANNPGRPLPRDIAMFLVGRLAEDPALREEIQARVDFSLQEFVPDIQFPPHLPVIEYAVNLGLALRAGPVAEEVDLEDGARSLQINLMPPRRGFRLPGWVRVCLVILAAGLVVNFFLYQRFGNAASETNTLRQRVIIVDRQLGLRRAEVSQITDMQKFNKEFASLVAPQGELTRILARITAAVPEGVEVAGISALSTNATVTGRAPGPAQVIQFVNSLRAIAGPTGAVFNKVVYSQVQSGPLSYAISATRSLAPTAP